MRLCLRLSFPFCLCDYIQIKAVNILDMFWKVQFILSLFLWSCRLKGQEMSLFHVPFIILVFSIFSSWHWIGSSLGKK